MMLHTLNCDPDVFDEIREGHKTFEMRLCDRVYRVGDTLDLRRCGPDEAREMRRLSELIAAGDGLSERQETRLAQLRDCPRLRCSVTSGVRISGAIVPTRPHWWKPSDAMQHGVIVMSIRVEPPSREAAGARAHSEARS